MRRAGIAAPLMFLVLSAASSLRAEAPTFFPVYDGHLILPYECPADDSLAWSPALAEGLGGLGPGSEVRLLTEDGGTLPARLGALTCLKGECRGDYAALPIEAEAAPAWVVAVAGPSESEPVIAISAADTPHICRGLPPQGNDPEGFGFPAMPPSCTTHRLSPELTVLVAGQGWMQENGWPVYRFYFQVLEAGATDGAWAEIDTGPARLAPRFAWDAGGGALRLLWTRRDGIAGPPAMTFREQLITPDGRHQWLSSYQAGGQPCD